MKKYIKDWYLSGCKDSYLGVTTQHNLLDDYHMTIGDCVLESQIAAEDGRSYLVLNINHSGGFCFYDKIMITDFIIKENSELEKPFCIADELYRKENGRYEYHILLQQFKKTGTVLEYLTINCKSIQFIGSSNQITFD